MSRASIDMAKYYRSVGALVFFEPSSISSDKKKFEKCLAVSDIVKFSRDRIPNYKIEFERGQVPLEIETLGPDGLRYRFNRNGIESGWQEISAPTMQQVIIDTAGAGDWCSAGIIRQVCSGGPLLTLDTAQIEECLNFGQLLGAMNCRYEGARGLMYAMDSSTVLKYTKKFKKTRKISVPEVKHRTIIIKKPFEISSLQ